MQQLDLEGEDEITFDLNPVYGGMGGHALMELERTYGGDRRFKLDSRFKGDVDYNKLPKGLVAEEEAPLEDTEKDKALRMLAEVVPAAQKFIWHSNSGSALIKRFDPTRPNQNLVKSPQIKIAELPPNPPAVPPQPSKPTKPQRPHEKVRAVEEKSSSKPKPNKRKSKKAANLRKIAPIRRVEPVIRVKSQIESSSAAPFKLFS